MDMEVTPSNWLMTKGRLSTASSMSRYGETVLLYEGKMEDHRVPIHPKEQCRGFGLIFGQNHATIPFQLIYKFTKRVKSANS